MIIEEDNYLEHYGTPRHSGRYPYGSGEDPHQTEGDFLSTVEKLRKQGMSDPDICKGLGIVNPRTGKPSTTQLRAKVTIARAAKAQAEIDEIWRLTDDGLSNSAIARQMGLSGESAVRAKKAPGAKERAAVLMNTANVLKKEVEDKKYVQVGTGVENYMNISTEKLRASVSILREQGYVTHNVPIKQLGTGKETKVKVLCPPGTTWGEVRKNRDQIQLPEAASVDGGQTFGPVKNHPIISIHPDRVMVRYGDEGGNKADGVIFVRPGVEDLSLGQSKYAQVRIKVGDGHYLKGMAMYKNDLPAGTDVLFNTNKTRDDVGNNKLDAMKPLKPDPNMPFGSVTRPLYNNLGAPNESVTSAMHIVHEQGQWADWSKSLSAQMLSKQEPKLARAQLDKTYERRKKEFDEINSLTNPVVKKRFLRSFSDSTDAAAVHLKAAALSNNQRWHAILPIESMPPGKIFAPNYKDGTEVVLIRYPHAGPFEIPRLIVDNKHKEALDLIGKDAQDAVGIHHSVAEHLSGADFDGDTVIVIPNNSKKIKASRALDQLKGFDPKSAYRGYPGMVTMTKTGTQTEMGKISNLITDMTIKGASHDELARAVKHSMVVIDAEKHGLNYRQSEIDHGITQLKKKYQGKGNAGASTLISQAGAQIRINERKERPMPLGGPIDRVTGERRFVDTGRRNQQGELIKKKHKRLEVTDDAHTLVSDANTPIERIYADHSNRMKALANQARLVQVNIPSTRHNPDAKRVYAKEVESLNSKLNLVKRNRPLERQALIIAGAAVKAKRDANPHLEKESLKKLEYDELNKARDRMKGPNAILKVEITQREWDAIQAGAISESKLDQILAKSDLEAVKKLATPRPKRLMTPTNVARAKAMLKTATRAEVAQQLGVSLSTLDDALKGES